MGHSAEAGAGWWFGLADARAGYSRRDGEVRYAVHPCNSHRTLLSLFDPSTQDSSTGPQKVMHLCLVESWVTVVEGFCRMRGAFSDQLFETGPGVVWCPNPSSL